MNRLSNDLNILIATFLSGNDLHAYCLIIRGNSKILDNWSLLYKMLVSEMKYSDDMKVFKEEGKTAYLAYYEIHRFNLLRKTRDYFRSNRINTFNHRWIGFQHRLKSLTPGLATWRSLARISDLMRLYSHSQISDIIPIISRLENDDHILDVAVLLLRLDISGWAPLRERIIIEWAGENLDKGSFGLTLIEYGTCPFFNDLFDEIIDAGRFQTAQRMVKLFTPEMKCLSATCRSINGWEETVKRTKKRTLATWELSSPMRTATNSSIISRILNLIRR